VTSRRDLLGIGVALAAGVAAAVLLPLAVETFVLVDLTVYAAMAILALSLALVWGFGGILNFGQSAFFGLGGYAYALAAINVGETTLPVLIGIAVPMLFAAVLGYFLFYGRVSDIYLGVITLCLSLILYNLINSAGAELHIGSAGLGGSNGIPSVPPLNVPGDASRQLGFDETFQVAVILLALVYAGLRLLLRSRIGRVIEAIRENELRAELLGYDARLYKLGVFVTGAGIAGLSGILFACWGSFIGPQVFSVFFTVQIIIWVMVGGLGTLVGPIVAAMMLHGLNAWLGVKHVVDTNIVLGALFVVFVLAVPSGIQPALRRIFRRMAGRAR